MFDLVSKFWEADKSISRARAVLRRFPHNSIASKELTISHEVKSVIEESIIEDIPEDFLSDQIGGYQLYNDQGL